MKSRILGFLAVALLTGPLNSQAAVIFESATMGEPGQAGGASLSMDQFLGSRFSLSSTTSITAIGGHMAVFSGTIFGAIVSLDSPSAFPEGNPLSIDTVLASTTFGLTLPTEDLSIPLSVVLGPGDYAVVFGSGLFGASGGGYAATNNIPVGFSSNIGYFDSRWRNAIDELRFTVYGEAVSVPEPGTLALLGLGLVGMGMRRRIKAS